MSAPRVIITAKLLCEMFGHLELETFTVVLGPWLLEEADAFEEFQKIYEWLRNCPDEPGKAGVISAFQDMENAYRKCSSVERKKIMEELPSEYVNVAMKKKAP